MLRKTMLVTSAVICVASAAHAADAPTFSREEVQSLAQIAVQQDRLSTAMQQPTAKAALAKMQPPTPPAAEPAK